MDALTAFGLASYIAHALPRPLRPAELSCTCACGGVAQLVRAAES